MTDLDVAALSGWLALAAPGLAGPLGATKFVGGQSNPTYRLECASGAVVLRRKPSGPLLPSAHAIEREYRLLGALAQVDFPAPRPLALCEDTSVIGVPFYLMELVEGRTFWNGLLPKLAPEDRRAACLAMVDVLARLHMLDHEALGLGDFGRPGNYFERQINRWTRQYRAAQTDDIPEVEQLIKWLPQTIPDQTRASIIHGDYRIDNLIYAPDRPTIAAVLDWELATIGDPLADFAYFAMNWILPHAGDAALGGQDLAAIGIPALDEIVARYCLATGREALPDLRWHFAYNLFRATGIIQGIKRRMLDGNASNTQAESAVAKLVPTAKAAWVQAQMAFAS